MRIGVFYFISANLDNSLAEYGGVYDDVKKSSEYIVDNAIVIKTGR